MTGLRMLLNRARYAIGRKPDGWALSEMVAPGLYRQMGACHKTVEDALQAMDYDVWLLNRELFPGKTFSEARRSYRKGRLGSHVEKDAMRGVWAQAAVAGGEALVPRALVRPMREDG